MTFSYHSSSPPQHCNSSYTVQHHPSIVFALPLWFAFCRQRRNTAVPQHLSNQLTVSSSPIPPVFASLCNCNIYEGSHCCFLEVFFQCAPESPRQFGAQQGAPSSRTIASCRPRYGCTVLFGLHAQSSDTGGLPVRVHVEIVRIDGRRHARPPEQTAHVSLSHVTPGTRHAQKVGDAAGRVWVRCHTGSHSVAGHDAARHRRRRAAATDPGRVLNLKSLGEEGDALTDGQNCGMNICVE